MPKLVEGLLSSRILAVLARVLLTAMFWSSGLAKIFDWQGSLGEMTHFNLNPPAVFAAATAAVQLIGSALIIWGRAAWLGAGMLAVFTALTIPVAHHFWNMAEPQRTPEMYTAFEHVALIGAFILVAMLRWRETSRR